MSLPAGALARWHDRQRELLHRHYLEAWQRGVDAYEPNADPPAQRDHRDAAAVAALGVGSHASALALSQQPYVKPSAPNEDRRRASLAAALLSLDRMVGEISDVAASPALAPGGAQTSTTGAVEQWVSSNAFRLAGGVGAAVWGGEQAGFAQAAAADGRLLIWICQEDDGSCPDCLELADLPAAPEEDWPTLPGGGGTACNGNCRCTMDYAPPGYNG